MTDSSAAGDREMEPGPMSPWSIVFVGVALEIVGSLVLASASDDSDVGQVIGVAVAGAGAIALLMGIVACGVVIGLRYHRDGPT